MTKYNVFLWLQEIGKLKTENEQPFQKLIHMVTPFSQLTNLIGSWYLTRPHVMPVGNTFLILLRENMTTLF